MRMACAVPRWPTDTAPCSADIAGPSQLSATRYLSRDRFCSKHSAGRRSQELVASRKLDQEKTHASFEAQSLTQRAIPGC